MTAEVAVLNRLGVALAADSAVTIGRDATKIFGSAEKLFQLSPSAPVGVMVYGNASFLGLPWETIIKTYRAQLGTTSFPSIADHAKNLREYLTDNEALFPIATHRRVTGILVTALYGAIRKDLYERLNTEAEQRESLEDSDLPPIVEAVFEKRLADILKGSPIAGFDPSFIALVTAFVEAEYEQWWVQVFEQLPFSDLAKELARQVAVEMLTRVYFGPMVGGVVVAGFGDSEFLPALVSFEVEEAALGRPRWREGSGSNIGEQGDASIIAFAQQEVVKQFLEGIDPALADHIYGSSASVLTGLVDLILQKLAEVDNEMAATLASTLRPQLDDIKKGLQADWNARRRETAMPVVGIAATLPKDELAAMAESLVNLTKFRRRVTPERETVGGPIDVAVITKGDGFVWVRRKHYFDPALNPRVVARLQGRT
ncbi:MAG: hypothetical protein IPJ56_16175 [Gemmatimonadetes bacterium]|nr:hypothetical protein [Gemmatimonadota bacterium]